MTSPVEAPAAQLRSQAERAMEEYIPQLAHSRPHLVRLAECLSLAAGVERPLLRRARLRFLPRSAAGLEAELWFSPLVEAASEHSLLLDPAAASVLRRRLARRPRQFVQDVRDMTVEAHLGAQPVARWFEDLLWADLFPATSTPEHIGEQLRRVLRAVTATGHAGDETGRWALHYVPRLPSGVRRYDDAWRIQVASCERLGLAPPQDAFARPPGTTASARALVQRDLPVGVLARSDGVVLSRPPVDGARTVTVPGVRTARVEAASVLAPRSAPVLLELAEGQSVHLPFAVVQRLSASGEPLLGIAHAGGAQEVAVASGAVAEGVRYAVLLGDGTIVLHGDDGGERGRVPGGATARGSLSLSTEGAALAWTEEGGAITYEVASGQRQLHGPARLVRFPADRGAGLVRLSFEDGGLLLPRRRVVLDIGLHEDRPVRALWLSADEEWMVLVKESGELWTYGPGLEEWSLDSNVVAVAGSPDGAFLVWAHASGKVYERFSGDTGTTSTDYGTTPWQVTSLAVSTDGQRIAAVGGDSRLMLWERASGSSVPRELRLGFCADRVFALPDGEWAVSGTGGPVELTMDDGRQYVITPDTEALSDPADVPAWLRGEVIAEVRAGRDPVTFVGLAETMASIRAAGVTCLAIGPITPFVRRDVAGIPRDDEIPDSLGDFGGFVSLLMSAHHHGVRVIVDVDLAVSQGADATVPVGWILDSMRQWLDYDADGLRLLDGHGLPVDVLTEVRHLLEGYEDRVLIGMRTTEPPSTAVADFGGTEPNGAACHVVVPDVLGGFGTGVSYSAGLETALVGGPQPLMATARPEPQWGHVLSDGLGPEQQAWALRILLCLPGCPVVPLSLLLSQDPEVAAMLELRREHLALSRGDVDQQDLLPADLLTLVRRHGDETVLCVANLGTVRVSAHVHPRDLRGLGEARLVDLLDGTVVPRSDDGSASLSVEGGAVRWYALLPIPRPLGPGE
ncbi:hypothetical protein [Streptomyces crystallinus]|uniref:Uncharacterized protein n=1 Tax=Streptomyces crystallinus TaxID=68191 RepID=A0ABN1FU75_9ACTN